MHNERKSVIGTKKKVPRRAGSYPVEFRLQLVKLHLEEGYSASMLHPTAASAAWVDDNILEIRTFCLDETFRDTYRIDFLDQEHPLKRTSRCSTFRPMLSELTRKQS